MTIIATPVLNKVIIFRRFVGKQAAAILAKIEHFQNNSDLQENKLKQVERCWFHYSDKQKVSFVYRPRQAKPSVNKLCCISKSKEKPVNKIQDNV